MNQNVIVSGSGFPPSPSASDAPASIGTSLPAATLVWNACDTSSSTPTTSRVAARLLTVDATPLTSPPPPIGAITTSVTGATPKISSAIVPAPATTSTSL